MLGCRRLAAPFWALYKDSALSLQFSRQSGVYNSRFVVVHAFILARIWRFGKFLLGELALFCLAFWLVFIWRIGDYFIYGANAHYAFFA